MHDTRCDLIRNAFAVHDTRLLQVQLPPGKLTMDEARDRQRAQHDEAAMRADQEHDDEDETPLDNGNCVVCLQPAHARTSDNPLLQCSNEECWHMVHKLCSMPSPLSALGVLCTRCTSDDTRCPSQNPPLPCKCNPPLPCKCTTCLP